MPKLTNRLTPMAVQNMKPGSRLADGQTGLYCDCRADGRKYWTWRYRWGGRVHWAGLGSCTKIGLKTVRVRVTELNQQIFLGQNPFQEAAKRMLFRDAAREFVAQHGKSLKMKQNRIAWAVTLGPKYCGDLMEMPVSEIGTNDILKCVSKIWWEKNPMARRLLSRLSMLMDYCIERNWRELPNPALKSNFKRSLPSTGRQVHHHRSMDYHAVPAFLAKLKTDNSLGAPALRFIIATALRANEAILLTWDEVDFENREVRLPAHRMKMKKPFTVSLNEVAVEVLREMEAVRTDSPYVFQGTRSGKPLFISGVYRLAHDAGTSIHGFRASMRTFAGHETIVPFEICEQCLSHEVGSAVTRAYFRGASQKRMAELWNLWGDWLSGKQVDNVVPLRRVG